MTTRKDLEWGNWPQIECRHHRHGAGTAVVAVAVIVSLAAYIYERGYEAARRLGTPAPKVITRTVTKTVTAHPALSGTDVVLITLIIAAMIVGGLSVARHLR